MEWFLACVFALYAFSAIVYGVKLKENSWDITGGIVAAITSMTFFFVKEIATWNILGLTGHALFFIILSIEVTLVVVFCLLGGKLKPVL